MTAEHEVQGVVDRLRWENIGIGGGEKIVLKAEALDVPACAPDARTVRHAIGCLGTLGIELLLITLKGLTEISDELLRTFVFGDFGIRRALDGNALFEALHQSGGTPAHAADAASNHLLTV